MRERPSVRPGVRVASWAVATLVMLSGTFFFYRGPDGAAQAAGLVTSLTVRDAANAADWSLQASLTAGTAQYGDRAFTYSSVPPLVAGAEWIRTANDSKTFTGGTLVTFTVAADAT